ncbi:MAG TPA: MFS transporter [Rectinemataceae bacterium]|nr:MFS transporter [Rectinemataceae bacterium]
MDKEWKKNLTLFLGSQAISIFGSMLVQYAIMWHITLTANSGSVQTLYIICGILPTFFISPFAGVWADRHDRRKLIMLSDSMIAATTLIVAIVFLLGGKKSLPLLLLASAVRAVGQGIQTPSVGAFLPQLVPQEHLTKANAFASTIQSIIMLASPLLSAALLSFASIEAIFFVDVATATIAVSILGFFLKVPPHKRATEKIELSYFHDLREGFSYIGSHTYLRSFFIFCAMFFFFAAPVAFLTPLQVTRSFGGDVWRLTAIEICFSLGMMGGGLFMGIWGGLKNRVRTMALSSFLTGIFTIVLGVVPVFWIYLLFMGLVGVSMPIFNTPATVLLQEKVEPYSLGRVFGVMGMISSVMMPVGMLLFGPIADAVRIEWLLVGSGAVIALLGFFLVGNKTLVAHGEVGPRLD